MGEEPEVDEVVFTRCGVGANGGGWGVGMGLLSSSKKSAERGEDGWEEEDEEEADGGEAETCYGAGLGELVTFFCCCSSGVLFGGDVDWKGGIVSLMLVGCDLFVFSFLLFSKRRGEQSNLPSSPIYVVL